MKIIIPMSGIGKRFLEAGYTLPKPLIDVDGIPMIYHVIDLFPGETNFHFICNEVHMAENNIESILKFKIPSATVSSVSTENRQGPVHAVSQIFDSIDDSEEVIVSYCDFGTQWNYATFLEDLRSSGADGGIAAYTGFHPHMLHGDNYAFMKHDSMWLTDIQEKASFTKDKMSEYASNGIYYFRTGALLKKYFQLVMDRNMKVNNEYYVSLVYKLMLEDSLLIRLFEIQKMLQWGTPRDLEEYLTWSTFFKNKLEHPLSFRGIEDTTLILPMAGAGSRFFVEGYSNPKPLISVEQNPMVVEAVNCLPPSKNNVFMCLQDHLNKYPLKEILSDNFKQTIVVSIQKVTEGQACTCELGLSEAFVADDQAILISASDNGAYYNVSDYYKLVDDPSVDIIVWSFTNNPTSKLYPQMYAWLDVDSSGTIHEVSVKKPFDTKENNHCIIGTMFFRHASLFHQGLQEVYANNIRTNGEFYVDNILNPLIQKGYTLKVFEVQNYLCWGTPNDYKTYGYWSEFFSKKV